MNLNIHPRPCSAYLPRRSVRPIRRNGLSNGSTANWSPVFRTGLDRAGSSPWRISSNCWPRKRSSRPASTQPCSFALPVVALAGALTAALYVPMVGFAPAYQLLRRPGRDDLSVERDDPVHRSGRGEYVNRFSLIGATRTLTQLFSYEAPFLLALLGPAIAAGTWQISRYQHLCATPHPWMMVIQPIGFVVALIGLMGKLELPPFDAPEAETEIVSGALTEYSGRGIRTFPHWGECRAGHRADPGRCFLHGRCGKSAGIPGENAGVAFRHRSPAVSLCPASDRSDCRAVVARRNLAGSGSNAGVDHLERLRCDL